MPTTYTHAVQGTSSSGRVTLGSNAAFDNMTAFTIGVLHYVDVTTSTFGRLLTKSSGSNGWAAQHNGTGIDASLGRATTSAFSRFSSSINNTAKWNWLFVTFDQSNGTNLFTCRSGLYGGTLTSRTGSNVTIGSGAFNDDSAVNMTIFLDAGGGSGARFVPVAFVGVWPSVLSTGTIDSYASDMDGNGGLTAATDYIKFDASMATSATSGKGLMTGTYTSISLVNGPDGTASAIAAISSGYNLYGTNR